MPYTVMLRGTAGPERDIANVRIYVDGIAKLNIPVRPGSPFETSFTHPGNVTVTISHSFVDTNGNESEPLSQTYNLPPERNRKAPAAPTTPMEVKAIYG